MAATRSSQARLPSTRSGRSRTNPVPASSKTSRQKLTPKSSQDKRALPSARAETDAAQPRPKRIIRAKPHNHSHAPEQNQQEHESEESEEGNESDIFEPSDSTSSDSESDEDLPAPSSKRPAPAHRPTAPKRPRLQELNEGTGQAINASIEDTDVMACLERQFSVDPADSGVSAGNVQDPPATFQSATSNPTQSTSDLAVKLLKVSNYKELLKEWPPSRINAIQSQQKKTGSAVPADIQEEARAMKKLYKHQKQMLTMMGKVSMYTLNKSIGDLGGTRDPDAYRLYLRYSKEARKQQMPKNGEGKVLTTRNKTMGPNWSNLSALRQKVFHPPVFYTLSGLPPPPNSDEDEEGPMNLSLEDRTELQELYDEMVCLEKVAKEYAKVTAGITRGPSVANYNKLSMKRVQKLHDQIENESTHMDFAYYFLAAGTHANTEAVEGSSGWCLEFTSHQEMADYVKAKSNFPTIFAAHTQGSSASQAAAQVTGQTVAQVSNNKSKSKTSAGDNEGCDAVRGLLAAALRQMLSAVLGYPAPKGFPRTADPVTHLQAKYGVRIVQSPGHALTEEDLLLGYTKMNSKRSLWLADVNAGLFTLEKDSDSNGKEAVVDSHVMDADVMNLDEEWTGIGDSDDELNALNNDIDDLNGLEGYLGQDE